MDFAPYIAGFALFFVSALIGIGPIRKLIVVAEAKHELKQGSAGFFRSISGWSIIAIWLGVTWFLSTIVGDWATSGDLDRAIERSLVRLEILIQILAALAESDS